MPSANERPFAVTVGEGRTNPQGMYLPCPASVTDVAEVLRKQPPALERWWSMHLWKMNKRKTEAWLASSGVVIDIDYKLPKKSPSPELAERLRNAAATGELPGAIFHLTPHGARLVWVYERPCCDDVLQKKSERGAGVLAAKALERLDLTEYQVDASCLGELARYFYTPNCIAKGAKRSADVFVIRTELTSPADLSVHDIKVRPVEPPRATADPTPISDFDQAVAKWNEDHPLDIPRHSSECPVCHDDASFGHLPDDPRRWYCFSTDHTTVGIKSDKGFHGDALDLEAHKRGTKLADVLKADGYLKVKQRVQNGHNRHGKVPDPEPPPDQEPDFKSEDGEDDDEQPIGYWRSRSYFTAVDLIQKNERNILENRKLELNEMSGIIELGRKPIQDADAHRIRYLIERRFAGGVDKQGNQVGLQVSASDVFAAITQVGYANAYHPVQQYLRALKWDGRARIFSVLSLLGAEDIKVNQMIVRRFFISAVARPLEPGCKVDTVLILVGPQGALKSSFFKALTDPWFVDTPINISNDEVRAYMTMRRAWILEWAELEALLRARDMTSVKAFLSSCCDSYVPKHARFSIDVMRGGIIVGSTNSDEFLSDDSGHRRFWPIMTGDINIAKVAELRDQLWAEAVALYNANTHCPACQADLFTKRCVEHRWWFTREEEGLLATRHQVHSTTDPWAVPIMSWVGERAQLSIHDVLQSALSIPIGQWTDRDMKRVARVLRESGNWGPEPNKARGKPRLWRLRKGVTGSLPGLENTNDIL